MYELRFVEKEITSWGGIMLLKNMIDKTKFQEVLSQLPLPEQGSNRAFKPIQILIQFMASVWCGANRYSHLDILRFDQTVSNMLGFKKMPEHKAFQRYFNKFDMRTTKEVFGALYKWYFENLQFNNFTLDIDSSVLTRYGVQEGAKQGYNKHKPGRKSQHPIIAFVSDLEMVANFWLRSGDSHTANNFKTFLEETLSNFGDKKIGLLRLDSGFYDGKIFSYLEERHEAIDYITAVPMHVNIQHKISKQRTWWAVAEGVEIGEFTHKAQSWEKERRMIVVRQKLSKRPKAVGKQLSIFEEDMELNGYRYTCYITSLKLSPIEVWRLYRQRAVCENLIKELKYDYGLDKMNQASFHGTEASLIMMTIAYNFMSLFKKLILNDTIKKRLQTIRYQVLAIPAYITNNKKVFNMALSIERRSWIRKLWNNSKIFEFN